MKIKVLNYLLLLGGIILLLSGCIHKDSNIVLPSDYTVNLLDTFKLSHDQGHYSRLLISAPGVKSIYFTVIALNANHYTAKLYLQPDNKAPQSVTAVAQQQRAQIGINGGFYTKDFKPDGLFIMKGQQLYPYFHAKVLSALVLINKKGQLDLQHKDFPYQQAYYAMQTGPILIDDGRVAVHPVNQLARRTLLAKTSKGQLLIINTSATSLYNVATIFHDHPDWFGIEAINTLANLDGGISTGLYFHMANKAVSINEIKYVKTIMLFYSK